MSDDAKYLNDGQQRLISLIVLLAGHEMTGMAPAQIAKGNQCTPSQVTRDLANLRLQGWAEEVPDTGRWRLGPSIVQIAMRHLSGLDRARTRLDEVSSRYSRG